MILSKYKDKISSSEFKPIQYAKTKSSKVSKSSNSSKCSKVSTDSSEPLGIQANIANIATFAKEATFGKVAEEQSLGPNPRKDAPTPTKAPLICAICGADLEGHGYMEKNGKFYCAQPGCGYPKRE